jgi:hypothetical protein
MDQSGNQRLLRDALLQRLSLDSRQIVSAQPDVDPLVFPESLALVKGAGGG